MQNLLAATMIFVVSFNCSFAQNQSMDSVSYSLGVIMSKSLQDQGFNEIDPASFADGILDLINGVDLKINEVDAKRIVNSYFREKKKAQFSDVVEESETFLSRNAARPEVTTLPSGLQYEVLKSGTGTENAKISSKVVVHYEGRLVDGTIFDSSIKRGQPITFGVSQVISGWTEALQLMVPGDKWKLAIPSDLAYGDQGSPPKIKPFSALIFEVELLEIK